MSSPPEKSRQQSSSPFSSNLLYSGFLLKQGYFRESWKSRWFELYPDELRYYSWDEVSPESKKILGKIPIGK